MKKNHWLWVAVAALATGLLIAIIMLISGGGESEPVSSNGNTQAEITAIVNDRWGDTPVLDVITFCTILDTDRPTFNIALNTAWEDPLERQWALSFYEAECAFWID